MYSLLVVVYGFLGYSYYDNIKKFIKRILYKYIEIEVQDPDVDSEEFNLIGHSTILPVECEQIVYEYKEKEYIHITDKFHWPIKFGENGFITVYLDDKDITSTFEKYAGPSKQIDKIYVRHILKDHFLKEDSVLRIMDRNGKYHVIFVEKYGLTDYYEMI